MNNTVQVPSRQAIVGRGFRYGLCGGFLLGEAILMMLFAAAAGSLL